MNDYTKYRWFFTSSGKLVIGGKSALQNDELLRKLKNKNYTVLHTSSPGSPFSVIIAEKAAKSDVEECAVFTGCFSRAWKENKKKTQVDIFHLSQLSKIPGMKIGSWSVRGKIEKKIVNLELVLTKQKGRLRAVPEITPKSFLLKIRPGKIDKQHFIPKLATELDEHFSQEEILSALPAGGIEIVR